MELEGASVLVTGGASGIGAASARRLAVLGAKPVICDLNEEKGKAIAEELSGTFVKTDVADESQVQAAVEAAQAMGPLRALVNAAGLHSEEVWLEESLRGAEPLVPDRDDLAVG